LAFVFGAIELVPVEVILPGAGALTGAVLVLVTTVSAPALELPLVVCATSGLIDPKMIPVAKKMKASRLEISEN
jgi:hypothetical protein